MTSNNRLFGILVPIISVLLGLLVGALIMLVSGHNPIEGYTALWNGAFYDAFTIGETIRRITPLILTGLAIAFAFRTGLFNIGAEGQVIVGWLAAVWVGIAIEAPMIIHLPLAIIAGALAGGIWGFIPGILKAKLGVHEVIVTIMMNYIALFVSNEIVRSVLTEHKTTTEKIASSASLGSEWLQSITFYSRLHYGILIALFAAAVMWFVINRTTVGYELKAVGFNRHASKYAGMNVSKNIVLSMVISGVFAGLAGVMEGLGTYGTVSVISGFTNLGFDGIAVALLGANNPLGVVLAAILFGVLKEGAGEMPSAGVPTELVDIIIAIIIFFVASSYIIRWTLTRFKKEGK
ncbi:ABC transporter permease [Ornithinibacillus bavariensis]|uniref:ABC transporter permease protein YufP n=1 Tax=Ornithinibacillus bavariensis TaxID=545502 RepID=A0A920C6K8_9BACI|nr:ABC transporter permease [Ornithinibacillus bavariensis]GIO26214.1 putative ABC transporter permease protein YufP [Ornithinibacillus bavariensis]